MSLEFTHGGQTYRTGKLDAKRQLHVTRRLAPIVVGLIKSGVVGLPAAKGTQAAGAKAEDILGMFSGMDLASMAEALTSGLATLTDVDVDFVLDTCLTVVEREQIGGGWAPAMKHGRLMFEDLDMVALLTITGKVLQDNLSGFFATLPQGSFGTSPT